MVCHKCEKRHPLCHSKCEKYIAFKETQAEQKKECALKAAVTEYARDGRTKVLRKAKNRRQD